MGLDFTKFNSIPYGGNGAKRGTPVRERTAPVEAAEPPLLGALAGDAADAQPPAEAPSKRIVRPFTGMDESRNYRAMYRAACDFHEAHNPPFVDVEYWKTHVPGEDETPDTEVEYWMAAAKDLKAMGEAVGSDPFLTGLLVEIYKELDREYKARRAEASRH